MKQLFINEHIKLFKTKSIYVMVVLLVTLSIGLILLDAYFLKDQPTFNESNWRVELIQEIDKLENKNKEIESKAESSIAEEIELGNNHQLIEEYTYHLENDIIPSHQLSLFNNLYSIQSIISVITLMLIYLIAGIFPKEYNLKTIKNLVSSPKSRFQIFISKYFGVFSLAFLLLLVMYGTVTIISLIFFELDSSKYLVITTIDGFNHVEFWPYFFKFVAAKFLYLIIIGTLAFIISVFSKSSTISILISFVLVFLSGPLMSFISTKTELSKYSLMENWDLSKYLPGNGLMSHDTTLFLSLTIILIHIIVLLGSTYMYFNRKDIMN